MKYIPLNNYILVQEIKEEQYSFETPSSVTKYPQVGVVVEISKECKKRRGIYFIFNFIFKLIMGKPFVIDLKPGDKILFRKHAGVEYGGFRFLNYLSDIIAKITDNGNES